MAVPPGGDLGRVFVGRILPDEVARLEQGEPVDRWDLAVDLWGDFSGQVSFSAGLAERDMVTDNRGENVI